MTGSILNLRISTKYVLEKFLAYHKINLLICTKFNMLPNVIRLK